MATVAHNKYSLKTLHEDISLLDRKLAHLLKYETFATDTLRDAAARKLSVKRDQLTRTAQQLASEGIEFKPSELPNSLRPKTEAPAADTALDAASVAAILGLDTPPTAQADPVYAGTSLDYRTGIDDYLRNRRRSA